MSIDRPPPTSIGKVDASQRNGAAVPAGFSPRQQPLSAAAAPVAGVSAQLTQLDIAIPPRPTALQGETTLRAGTLSHAAQSTPVSSRIRAESADTAGIADFDAVGTVPAGILAMPSLALPIGANIVG